MKIREFESSNNLPNIPVLFVTADADAECQKRVHNLGIDTVLIKPFTYSQLKTALTTPNVNTFKSVSRASTIHFESVKRSDTLKVFKPLRSLTANFAPMKTKDIPPSPNFLNLPPKNSPAANAIGLKTTEKSEKKSSSEIFDSTLKKVPSVTSPVLDSPKKVPKAPPLASLTLQSSRASKIASQPPPPLASVALEKLKSSETNNIQVSRTRSNGSFDSSNAISEDSKLITKENEAASYFSSVRSIIPNSEARPSVNSDKRGSLVKPDKIYGTVLCADDNPMNQKLVARFLNVIGYDYVIANDGQECFDIYSSNPSKFCSILMDCSMPIVFYKNFNF